MAVLRQRRCIVIVDSLRVEGLRVAFRVEKSTAKEPNTLELTVNNLAESSRANMQSKGSRVVVLAGYEEDYAQIFAGDSRVIDHRQDGPDWTTKIACGDGERAYQFSRVSESFGPGTPVAAVVRYLCRALLTDTGNALEQADAIPGTFIQGCSVYGKASAELEKVLRPRGFSYSIQDGQLQILRGSEPARQTAVVLSPDTGLIGSPEAGTSEKKGGHSVLKLKSLLRPQLRPGARVDLRSATHRGIYRVEKLTHSGDTAGGDWFSELEVKPTT